jgi:drug/metabolite transporter (DMT)-like permease
VLKRSLSLAQAELEATVATISATIEPVIATLWAALFLGEPLTWPQVEDKRHDF